MTEVFPEDLKAYYEKLFPCDDFFVWLSGGKPERFYRREFSFTLDGDIYCRYLSFKSATEFRSELVKRCPSKIDIGAIFSSSPKEYHMTGVVGRLRSFEVRERELVFDIDMNDYDEVRTCCKGASICKKCWTFLASAIQCINRSLVEDFGFEKILFVFSGRRGVHCWVSDEIAMNLSNNERAAVAEYLQLIQGSQCGSRVNLRKRGSGNHPLVKKSFEICKVSFEKREIGILEGQEPIEFLKKILINLIDEFPGFVTEDIQREILKGKNCTEIWRSIKDLLFSLKSKTLGKLNNRIEELVLELTYARLDINVSKHMNHLLKAPFCVHPKTGKICVPIINAENFDPSTVPTLTDVLKSPCELDESFKYFRRYVAETRNSKVRQDDIDMSF